MARSDVVHDPQVLRAIAHPVRNRILSELDAQGSLRAADVARELDIPANQASFHLRQLAKYGLVEEDPDAARDRRDRVWRAVHPGGLTINLEELAAAPGGAAAARVFRASAASWAHLVVDRAYAGEADADDGPRPHRSIVDLSLRLTQDEARAFSADLQDLVAAWGERTRGPRHDETDAADEAEAAQTYVFLGFAMPHPEQQRGPSATEDDGERA